MGKAKKKEETWIHPEDLKYFIVKEVISVQKGRIIS